MCVCEFDSNSFHSGAHKRNMKITRWCALLVATAANINNQSDRSEWVISFNTHGHIMNWLCFTRTRSDHRLQTYCLNSGTGNCIRTWYHKKSGISNNNTQNTARSRVLQPLTNVRPNTPFNLNLHEIDRKKAHLFVRANLSFLSPSSRLHSLLSARSCAQSTAYPSQL